VDRRRFLLIRLAGAFAGPLDVMAPTEQRLGRLTESWRRTDFERDPQKLF